MNVPRCNCKAAFLQHPRAPATDVKHPRRTAAAAAARSCGASTMGGEREEVRCFNTAAMTEALKPACAAKPALVLLSTTPTTPSQLLQPDTSITALMGHWLGLGIPTTACALPCTGRSINLSGVTTVPHFWSTMCRTDRPSHEHQPGCAGLNKPRARRAERAKGVEDLPSFKLFNLSKFYVS